VTSTEAPAAPDAPPGDVAVRLRGIGKRFPGVIANDDVNIDVRRGTIHAIERHDAGKTLRDSRHFEPRTGRQW